MDQVTPLYQERLNSLPPAQRRVVLQMAFLWESSGAKEIAAASRMDNKVVSAQLKQLADKGVVEKIETATKNHLYRISERFFNLWLIFTQGSPADKRKAKYLTIFLENFYDDEELRSLGETHLESLKKQELSSSTAVLLTKAFAQSKYISIKLRDQIVTTTHSLPGINKDLTRDLPFSSTKLISETHDLIENGRWADAHHCLDAIEQHDGYKYFLKAWIYEKQEELLLSEKYLLLASKYKYVNSFNSLGLLYFKMGKNDLAETYLKIGMQYDSDTSRLALAHHYYLLNKNKVGASKILEGVKDLKAIGSIGLFIISSNKLWNSFFKEALDSMPILIQNGDYDLVAEILMELLKHYQTNLVLEFLKGDNLSDEIVSQYRPIYYASLMLMDTNSIELKIPPEILEPVNKIIARVKKGQDFYHRSTV